MPGGPTGNPPQKIGYKFNRPLSGHIQILGRYQVDGAGIVNIIQP